MYQTTVLLFILMLIISNSLFTVHFKLKGSFINNKFRIAISYLSHTVKKSRFVHWQRKSSLVVSPVFLILLVMEVTITLEILVVNKDPGIIWNG